MKKLLLVIFLISCTKTKFNTPEAVLKSYMAYAFSHPLPDPKEMASFLTGPLFDEYLGMNEEELTNLKAGKYRNYTLKILAKKCHDSFCNLTYILRYESYTDKVKDFTIEVRKMAEIHNVEDYWKIADIETNRMVVNSLIPINVSEED